MNWKKKRRWLNRQAGLEKRDPLPRERIDEFEALEPESVYDAISRMADAIRSFGVSAEAALSGFSFGECDRYMKAIALAGEISELVGNEVPYDPEAFVQEWGYGWDGRDWIDLHG